MSNATKRLTERIASLIARWYEEDLTNTEWDELRDTVEAELFPLRWRSGRVPSDGRYLVQRDVGLPAPEDEDRTITEIYHTGGLPGGDWLRMTELLGRIEEAK